MSKEHPITPPPDLVQRWRATASVEWAFSCNVPATLSTDPGGRRDYIDYIATRAAQWGADQELEACCEWLEDMKLAGSGDLELLRADRRPKPPSLKAQALHALGNSPTKIGGARVLEHRDHELIRRALEALDDTNPASNQEDYD